MARDSCVAGTLSIKLPGSEGRKDERNLNKGNMLRGKVGGGAQPCSAGASGGKLEYSLCGRRSAEVKGNARRWGLMGAQMSRKLLTSCSVHSEFPLRKLQLNVKEHDVCSCYVQMNTASLLMKAGRRETSRKMCVCASFSHPCPLPMSAHALTSGRKLRLPSNPQLGVSAMCPSLNV